MARNRRTKKPSRLRQLLIMAALILVALLVNHYLAPGPAIEEESPRGSLTVEKAAADRISGVMFKVSGEVSRVLSDDNEGSRHQRFIVTLPSGHTVLVSHNIDLAPRVPLTEGDQVDIHGQYEWNDRGGVIHWTHHDPAGRHVGGWVDHKGQRYE